MESSGTTEIQGGPEVFHGLRYSIVVIQGTVFVGPRVLDSTTTDTLKDAKSLPEGAAKNRNADA